MNKIITIRGTSGAGKSTVIHTLLSHYPHRAVEPEVTKVDLPTGEALYVLGRYASQCGGCDAMKDYSLRVPLLVAKYHPLGHVVFEGLLVSGAYGKIGEALEQYGDRVIYAFLDTPLETCQARIDERRARAGKPPLPSHHNTEAKFKAVLSVKEKVARTQARVVDLPHQQAVRAFLRLIGCTKDVPVGVGRFNAAPVDTFFSGFRTPS